MQCRDQSNIQEWTCAETSDLCHWSNAESPQIQNPFNLQSYELCDHGIKYMYKKESAIYCVLLLSN